MLSSSLILGLSLNSQLTSSSLFKLHALLGNKWSLIAGRLPGRIDNEIKNYWNTHIKRKLRSRGLDPQTHRPLNEPTTTATTTTHLDFKTLSVKYNDTFHHSKFTTESTDENCSSSGNTTDEEQPPPPQQLQVKEKPHLNLDLSIGLGLNSSRVCSSSSSSSNAAESRLQQQYVDLWCCDGLK